MNRRLMRRVASNVMVGLMVVAVVCGLVASYLQWHLERVLKSLKHVERT